MSVRRILGVFSAAVVVAIAALMIAGASDHRDTAFSLDVPNNIAASLLQPGESLCQGPIDAQAGFRAMQLWSLPAGQLGVTVRIDGKAPIRTRLAGADRPTGRQTFSLGARSLARGETFSVCVRNLARRPVTLQGGQATRASGRLTVAGQPDQDAVAMVFLRGRGPSLLSLLPTVFERASLFKLSWVGAWTFWLLLAGILAAVGLAAAAIVAAVRLDEDAEAG